MRIISRAQSFAVGRAAKPQVPPKPPLQLRKEKIANVSSRDTAIQTRLKYNNIMPFDDPEAIYEFLEGILQ